MKVELKYIRDDAANAIGDAASKCYDGKTDRESNIRRAKSCKDKGHLATMRFAYAEFDVSGISRVCSHQIVRMAHAGILQESQRYVEQTKIFFVIPKSIFDLPSGVVKEWQDVLARSAEIYKKAIDLGVKKEDARYILPQSCHTSLRLCLNFQGWQDFLRNRTDKAAQWEVRDVALEIERQLHEKCPELF